MKLWTNYMTKTIFKNEQVNKIFIIPIVIFILKAKNISLFKSLPKTTYLIATKT